MGQIMAKKIYKKQVKSMITLPKMHYQKFMWYYSFQNYKMVTVDIKLNIYYKWKPCSFTFLATFSFQENLATDQIIIFPLAAYSS